MADPKGSTTATAKAPGASVVRAIANEYAAGFTDAAIEEARNALSDRYQGVGEDGQPANANGLTPMQKRTLSSLDALRLDIVKATTVPATNGEVAK